MKLILFDIDGILIHAGEVKFDYWQVTIKKHFGLDIGRNSIYMQGKTDREILFELVQTLGIVRIPRMIQDSWRRLMISGI